MPPLPAEFFQDMRRRRWPADNLRRGLVLLLVGVAITLALGASDNGNALWGLVPAAVGLAYLLVYFIEGRRPPRAEDSRPDERAG